MFQCSKVIVRSVFLIALGISFMPMDGMSVLRTLANPLKKAVLSSKTRSLWSTRTPIRAYYECFNAIQPTTPPTEPSWHRSFQRKQEQPKSNFWSRARLWAAAGTVGITSAIAYWLNNDKAIEADPFGTFGRGMVLFVDENGYEVGYKMNPPCYSSIIERLKDIWARKWHQKKYPAFYGEFMDILKNKSSSMLANASFCYTMFSVAQEEKEPLEKYLAEWDIFEHQIVASSNKEGYCNGDFLRCVTLLVPKSWGVVAGKINAKAGIDLTDFVYISTPTNHFSKKFLRQNTNLLYARHCYIGSLDTIVPTAKKLLLEKRLDKHAKKYPWNFYVGGHGGKPPRNLVCGMKCEKFQEFLDYLHTEVSTKSLTYSSCYTGSKERLYDLYKGNDGMQKHYDFPIICCCFGNTVAYSSDNTKFTNFFKTMAHITVTPEKVSDISTAISCINLSIINNIPHVRWANSDKFDLLHEDAITFNKDVVSVKLAKSTSPDLVGPIKILNKQCVGSITLSSEQSQAPLITSGDPTIDDHHIQELSVTGIHNPNDLSKYFLNHGNVKRYYIDTLRINGKVLHDCIVYKDAGIIGMARETFDHLCESFVDTPLRLLGAQYDAHLLRKNYLIQIGGEDARRKELQAMAATVATLRIQESRKKAEQLLREKNEKLLGCVF